MPNLLVTKVLSSEYKGDLAIAIGMLARLQHARPHWNLTILCRRPDEDGHRFNEYGDVDGELFSGASLRAGSRGRIVFRVLRYLSWASVGWPALDRMGKRYTAHCRKAEVLVFCGGGSPGGYGLPNLILHAALPVMIARRLGRPVVFTGLGAEALPRLMHRLVWRWTLNQAEAIGARDPLAAETMRHYGIRAAVSVTADWAFDLTPTPPVNSERQELTSSIREDRPLIIMNLRDEKARGPEHEQRGADSYRALIAHLARVLLEQTDAIVIVPSMTESAKTSDSAVAERVRTALPAMLKKRFVILPPSLDPQAIKWVIGKASMVVATRLHPLIFAVSQGIPTLALHDLRKVRGYMHYCGLDAWYIPVANAVPELVEKKALQLFADRHAVSKALRQQAPLLSAAVDRNIELIDVHLRDDDQPNRASVSRKPSRKGRNE